VGRDVPGKKITEVERDASNGRFLQEDGECTKAIVNGFLFREHLRTISTRILVVLEQGWQIMMIVRKRSNDNVFYQSRAYGEVTYCPHKE
jgi:hypothetical protein